MGESPTFIFFFFLLLLLASITDTVPEPSFATYIWLLEGLNSKATGSVPTSISLTREMDQSRAQVIWNWLDKTKVLPPMAEGTEHKRQIF